MRCSLANDQVKRLLRWLGHKPQFWFLGRIEHLTGHHRLFNPYDGPMNGQTARLEITRSILEHCAVARVIETGTYRGTTTRWLAQFALPVVTVEISPRYAAFAHARLRDHPNVDVRLCDSVTMLSEISRHPIDRHTPTFFYLDAHWRAHLPLKEELDIISSFFPRAIVMIDDFQVPSDFGYGYDDYGPGKVLDLNLLGTCKVPPDPVFFPSVESRWETGRKRGCVVFAYDPALIKQLNELPLLRPHGMHRAGPIAAEAMARRAPLVAGT